MHRFGLGYNLKGHRWRTPSATQTFKHSRPMSESYPVAATGSDAVTCLREAFIDTGTAKNNIIVVLISGS